ncbi:hypothetical protein F444_04151 [Phytophthora nicotianae P1976]|uniref:Integrase catalytic domain-containing protein n=1 Tax=Phytophthora nicotianae P1976 TaxID=1317066 RepID=A0A081ARQ0_PHYNI|nr:hypothetical protein F444_04151 [Phytophthora nicotianae P1976]
MRVCEGEVHHLCSNDLFDPENLAVHPQCVFSWKAQTEAKSKNDGPEAFEIVGSVSDESRRQLTFEDAGRRFLSSLHQEADEVLDRWLSHNVPWVQVAVQQADDKGLTAEMMTVLLLVRRNGTVRWSLQGLFKYVDVSRWFKEVGAKQFPLIATVNLLSQDYMQTQLIYLLRHKSEPKSHIIALVNRLHVKYRAKDWRVEEIHSDQGGEFDNTCLHEFGAKEGIYLSTTNGCTP